MNVQIHPRIKFYSKLHLDWIIKLEGRVEFDKVSSKNEWLARQLEFDIISFFYDIDYIIQHDCTIVITFDPSYNIQKRLTNFRDYTVNVHFFPSILDRNQPGFFSSIDFVGTATL